MKKLIVAALVLASCGPGCINQKCVTQPVTGINPANGQIVVTVATMCICLDEEK